MKKAILIRKVYMHNRTSPPYQRFNA